MNRNDTHCRNGHPWTEGTRRVCSDGEVRCRTCQSEKQRRYKERHPEVRERRRLNQMRWRNANKEKERAHSIVAWWIKKGRLVRPAGCEECGGPKPQAAHWEYDRPLDVRWLCAPCHSRWDAERRGATYV